MSVQFFIEKDPAVWWPVTVRQPANDGSVAEFQFKARVRVLPEEAIAAILPAREPLPGEAGEASEAREPKPLREVLAENAVRLPKLIDDWQGVQDAAGPVPIARLPELLVGPYGRALSIGLYQAVHQVRFGMPPETPPANAGNSSPPPVTG